MMIRIALIALLVLITGCETTQSDPEFVRICDNSGCSMRPANTASFNPASVIPDEDPDGRLAALEQLAENDPRAAYDLGLRYYRGDGVRQNSYQALQWMRAAGEGGDLQAQQALGRFYTVGLEEMGPDLREAQRWLRLAAAQGDSESQQLLEQVDLALQDEYYYRQRIRNWRSLTYNYWYGGYPYRWRWYRGYWTYYY